MDNISQVVPVVPVSLMSGILVLHASEWKSELELKSLCAEKIGRLERAGAPIDISHSALESVLGSALDAMIGRGLVEEKDNLFRMKESETDILNYYANSIVHWQ